MQENLVAFDIANSIFIMQQAFLYIGDFVGIFKQALNKKMAEFIIGNTSMKTNSNFPGIQSWEAL